MDEKYQKAFMAAYAPCHDAFARYCSVIAFGHNAKDVMQDVLLSAFKHFERIESKDDLMRYLCSAARKRVASEWRRRHPVDTLSEHHAASIKAEGATGEDILQIESLYSSIRQLPEKERDALVLHAICGYSYKEIAEIQGTTEGAIKTKASRARQKLKTMLDYLERDISSNHNFQSQKIEYCYERPE